LEIAEPVLKLESKDSSNTENTQSPNFPQRESYKQRRDQKKLENLRNSKNQLIEKNGDKKITDFEKNVSQIEKIRNSLEGNNLNSNVNEFQK
jgi:hypothetical protein